MKVFLGGTCNGYDWRKDLIPLLNCDYYNPVVENWSEEDRLREVEERKISDYTLYVITSDMQGVYSIAEVVDDSNKRPEGTLFCVLTQGFDEPATKSLNATMNLVKENGATTFTNLADVAKFLNDKEKAQ